MRRVLPWISTFLILLTLVGCSAVGGGRQPVTEPPTGLSEAEASTQVAQMLTQMAPTNSGVDGQAVPSATAALPTVSVETPQAGEEVPTATVDPEVGGGIAPTATVAPTTAPTQAPLVNTATPIPPTATQPPAPSFTPPAGDPRQRIGAPSSTDPMNNPSTWVWPEGSDQYTTGNFNGGSMAITALTDTDGWRMANPLNREINNLYLEATIRTGACSGSDHYGLIVRVPDVHAPDQGYLFSFTCDGRYSLRRWDGEVEPKGEMTWLVNWTSTPAIAAGPNQTNRISMFASGNRLILYANGTLLTEVKDATFPDGYFGVLVGADQTDDLTVYVDEMSYWENPQP